MPIWLDKPVPGADEFHNVLTNVATVHQFVGVAQDKMGRLGTGEPDVRRREPDPSSEGSVAGSIMSSPRAGPSSIRTAGDGPVVVSDIALRPRDSDDTVTWEIKAA